MEESSIYDVIIIGAGPAGMTAALYTSRSDMSTLIIDRGAPGGKMLYTEAIENYTGYNKIDGPDLAMKMFEHATSFGAKYQYGVVTDILPGDDGVHTVVTETASYKAYSVIIATGSESRKLGIPGEKEYAGRGVSYCAVCDGAFFRDKNVKVIGGGDSAVEEGTYLTNFAEHVDIIHRRDQLRAQRIIQDRAFDNEKIGFSWDSVVSEIKGDEEKVTSIVVKNVKTGESKEVPAEGVFIYIGALPNNESLKDLKVTNDDGWVLTDENMTTSVPGIFAAGDIRNKKLRQVTNSVGDGGIAGQEAYNYVASMKADKKLAEAK